MNEKDFHTARRAVIDNNMRMRQLVLDSIEKNKDPMTSEVHRASADFMHAAVEMTIRMATPETADGYTNRPCILAGVTRETLVCLGHVEAGKIAADEIYFSYVWKRLLYPTFDLTDGLAANLLLTDTDKLATTDIPWPFPAFVINIPSGCRILMKGDDGREEIVKRISVMLWRGTEVAEKSSVSSRRVERAARDLARPCEDYEEFLRKHREFTDAVTERESHVTMHPSICIRGHNAKGISIFNHQMMSEEKTVAAWQEAAEKKIDDWAGFKPDSERHLPLEALDHIALAAIQRLAVNTALYLKSEDPITKRTVWSPEDRGTGPTKKFWTIGRSVKVSKEIREAAQQVAAGVHRSSPMSRHVVRGHYKTQRHGTGRQQIKSIYVTPYWRGPVDGPTAARKYDLR